MKVFAVVLVLVMSLGVSRGKCPGDVQCSKCGSEGSCDRCIDSFYTEKGCDTAVTPVAHCWGYDDKTTCNECDFGFVLKANTCQACKVAGCALCDDLDACSACYGGVVTDGKSCAASLPKCDAENCDACVFKEVCLLCKSGFALNSLDKCEPAPKNCFVSEKNLCSACHSGFYLTEQGTCSVVATRASSHLFLYFAIGLVIVIAVVVGVFFANKRRGSGNEEYTRAEPA